jgi:hypothetical protein
MLAFSITKRSQTKLRERERGGSLLAKKSVSGAPVVEHSVNQPDYQIVSSSTAEEKPYPAQ